MQGTSRFVAFCNLKSINLFTIKGISLHFGFMVGVAQLVRALGCGPRGRGFESLHSPQ